MRQTPNEIWSEILENLNDTARQDVYLHQAVPLSLTADALQVAVPSAYTRTRIEERFRADIQQMLATLIGAQCVLTLIIDESIARTSEDSHLIDQKISLTHHWIRGKHLLVIRPVSNFKIRQD